MPYRVEPIISNQDSTTKMLNGTLKFTSPEALNVPNRLK